MLLQTNPAKKGMSLADEHIGAWTNGLSMFLKRVTEMSLGLPWGRGDGRGDHLLLIPTLGDKALLLFFP